MSREWGTGVPLVRLKDPKTGKYVDKWQTQAAFSVTLKDGRRVTVPAGFVYDKASVPRFVWAYIPRDDKDIVDAALVHDYLYTVQKIEGKWIPRETADAVFLELMERAGARLDKRRLAYRAVRCFGWRFWNPRGRDRHNPFVVDEPVSVGPKLPFDPTRRL